MPVTAVKCLMLLLDRVFSFLYIYSNKPTKRQNQHLPFCEHLTCVQTREKELLLFISIAKNYLPKTVLFELSSHVARK